MLIKVSIVHRTNTTSDATQLKPRRRGEGGGSTWPWKTLGAILPTFDEGWWCSGGVTRLVGGWCAVDHWFKPGKFIVDERRQNRGWLLLKCWIQTFPSLPLSFRLLALTYVSHPPPQRGEINLAPSPPSRRDITASHLWIYAPLSELRACPFLFFEFRFRSNGACNNF